MSQKKFIDRANFLVLVFFLLLAYIGLRLFSIQVVQGASFRERANYIRFKVEDLQPNRGRIFDRSGEVLARDTEAISIYALPPVVEDAQHTASTLATLLDRPENELLALLESGFTFVWIQRKVPLYVAEQLTAANLNGIEWRRENFRFYPQSPRLSNLIGFVGTDHSGLEGIEFTFDEQLTGKMGYMTYERDAMGREIPGSTGFLDPEPGFDMHLTIDTSIQFFVERALDAAMDRTRAKRGVVIVNNPRSGDILAMASRPTFESDNFWAYPTDNWKNLGISMVFEPGSTIKPLVVAAVLEEGLTYLQESFFCPGHVMVYNHRVRDIKAHGDITLRNIIADSCNVGTIKLAQRLGEERLYKYIRDFGIGQNTGSGIDGEEMGLLRRPQNWSALSIGAIPIGQEILVTPLQLLSALSGIANRGVVMRPRIVSRIVTHDGKLVEEYLPSPVERVVSPESARLALEMMFQAVEEGTGKKASIPGYRIVGKTGTGQKIGADGRYMHNAFISSFVGFFPYPEPDYGIVVILDEAQGEYYGGDIAAPVFREIAQEIIGLKGMRPENVEVQVF